MKIGIFGLDSIYHREVERIFSLFFAESQWIKAPSESLTLKVNFLLTQFPELKVQVRLTDPLTGRFWEKQRSTEWRDDEQWVRRKTKQLISYVLLQVLHEYTGIQQPWGILTGVRPTKLFHRFFRKGMDSHTIESKLQHEYQILPGKTSLLNEIVQQKQKAIPDLYHLKNEVSIYIGIPFCPTKCAYCTFPAYSIQGRTGSVEDFLTGLHEEIAQLGSWLQKSGLTVTTLYWGGGTPTSITADQMDRLFDQCQKYFPDFDRIREITIEAGRPDTLEPEKLKILKKWPVDRISINPQSFQEETLRLIGRHHTVQETLEKFELARQMGFDNINMDLIIGLPNEGIDIFQQSLQVMEELRPESLTVHTLSFKRGSYLSQNKEKYQVAERNEVAQMVQMARDWARKMEYRPYYLYRQSNILGNQENVGYARAGKESLYNILIMEEMQTIIALGCGAVSKIVEPDTGKITRWANPKEPKAYIDTYQHQISGKIKELERVYRKCL